MEHYLLHRDFSFILSKELKTPPHFTEKPGVFAWEASKSFPINKESFLWVMYNLFSIFDEKSWQFKMIARFIIALYDWVNIHENVNEAWRQMFSKKRSNLENISLTQYALHLHVMKASLLIRHKHNMEKVKTILLIILMRRLKILEQ